MSSELYHFVKMHGSGNDFILMDARSNHFPFEKIKEQAPELCKRRTGIGADGILMLGSSRKYDYTMHYLNADGSEAGMCGNGARCLAKYAFEQGFSRKLSFEVRDNLYQADVKDGYVSLYFPVKPEPKIRMINEVNWYELNAGTEHVVSIEPDYADTTDEEFRAVGQHIRNRTDLFPVGTNVNFSHIVNENRLKLVTYERGVEDLTLSCGTGAIATAVAYDFMKNQPEYPSGSEANPDIKEQYIQIDCPGGPLEVSFKACNYNNKRLYQNIILHGPAVSVYQGHFLL